MQCLLYGKQQQTYSAFHDTAMFKIQMASSAQEPAIYTVNMALSAFC